MADSRWPGPGGGGPPPPILLDAAMGTRLIARGLDLSGDDPCLWCLDRPEEVAEVHRLDVMAGADALTTNTFGANRSWLSRFGRAGEVGAINRAAVALAREAAGPGLLVLGCLGPTAEGSEVEVEQALALAAGGVDALILETNAASAPIGPRLAALDAAVGLPMILTFSLAVDDDPFPRLGYDVFELPLQAIGWNCIPPPRAVELPGHLRGTVGLPLVLQPSGPWIGSGPGVEPTAETIARLVDQGVRLFGGCCGTTERDIAALRSALGPSPLRAGSG
ncbi:homocysteine S-methyltransferase family protein [Tautonia plasticadhaerens]|uniref:Bifunctional homocysteine S-methyltransferase/5,10-methylenetetrahydrofolate reductase n=1 Tax=Tautonia plasticadhaerens TaxID=2527974 RepID=A0A518HD09_9BACT|nr:homocysteine S-methyltransferase family protein [Tautonia plasticadhaerens]QDV38742.1 Bifunctional homocysteine S-methyltransferase/5,10-methylenetetrahydrofolate reductase [Tautonia plasticadhaerens]